MFAEVNGLKIYYETKGEGQPLMMVHGNSEDHTIFIGLLTALKTDRISRMVLSGTNLTVNGVVLSLKLLVRFLYFFTKDQKMWMILNEPDIKPETLKDITIPVTVVAGEKDMVKYEETKLIADSLPNSKLRIIPKAGHGSYIVHKSDIADIILEETGKK